MSSSAAENGSGTGETLLVEGAAGGATGGHRRVGLAGAPGNSGRWARFGPCCEGLCTTFLTGWTFPFIEDTEIVKISNLFVFCLTEGSYNKI